MPDITLQQIETFLAVAEHLNFSEAAKAQYISQPALSKIIIRLENSLGTTLFFRKGHRITLTKEGEYLYNELKPLYTRMNQTLSNVGRLSDRPKKHLRLAFHTSYDFNHDFSVFGRTFRRYKEEFPDVAVTEGLFEFKDLRNVLMDGEADIIYTTSFVFEDMKCASYKKIEEHRFFILMSVDHPLAACQELPIAELGKETFFFVAPSFTNESEFERCAQMGFTPKNIVHLPNFPSVINAVRQGRGLTFCGNAVTTLTVGDIKYFLVPNVPDPPFNGVAWRTNDVSKEALDFIAMLPGA